VEGLPVHDLTDQALAEAAWLRRLARGLVRSDAEADDVAQETWLAALRGGWAPAQGAPPRGWLARVARRVRGRRQRSELRRRDHEALAAEPVRIGGARVTEQRGPADPSDPHTRLGLDEVSARLELARVLAEELARLPEPYRSTLYRRYYEGESAEAIAARDALNAGTVRWRLARGRELLRAALVQRDGRAWSSWAVALAPLATAPPAAMTTIGAITTGAVMTLKGTCIGAALGVLAAGASWALRPADDTTAPAAVAPDESATRTARAVAPALGGSDAPTSPATREVASIENEAALDPLFGIVCHGRIVDEQGVAVAGARLALESSDGALTNVTSDDAGGWSTFGLAPGPYQLDVHAEGYLTRSGTVDVPAARAWRHDVVLIAGAAIPVRFEDPSGAVLATSGAESPTQYLVVGASRAEPGARLLTVGHGLYVNEAAHYRSRASSKPPAGLGERYDGVLQLTAPTPLWVAAAYRDVVLETRRIDGREQELVFVVDPTRFDELAGTVRVRLVDRDTGAALTDGAALSHPTGGTQVRPTLDGETLVFTSVPPGALQLYRYARSYERFQHTVDVVPGGVTDLGILRIGRAHPLEVRVVDELGAPRAIRISAVRPELCAGPGDLDLGIDADTNEDGVTWVTWLAPGETLVRAGGHGGLARVALQVDTSRETSVALVVPSGSEVVVRGQQAARGRVYVLNDAAGQVLYGGNSVPTRCFLAPGAYALVRLDDERETARQAFTVGGVRTVVQIGEE
jgi:RNA polymerase sigma factor (sigma-70 family)